MAERFERLEETLQICLQMWSDDDGPYVGRHYRLAETVCVPPPLARPHPPVIIGGAGERKTLRMVAQYAQACNIFSQSPDGVAHKLEVLRGHCGSLGTDYDAIEKTMLVNVNPLDDVDGFLRQTKEYADLGITLVTLMPRADDPVAWTTGVCESVLPRMADL
jgi:alkanesulfonate monooxygenase SsuD/methylene tetrahydromethanopterin reductase-like flavin-dependent oxidoreductase (luciferase family)